MRHLVMYSGGVASWDAARLAIENYGSENVDLLFTDTLHEDKDLYRFLVEGAAALKGVTVDEELREALTAIGDVWVGDEVNVRKTTLRRLAELSEQKIPGFYWRGGDETLWESFDRHRALGSSRLQFCSRDLKVTPSNKFIEAHYKVGEVTLHFGLDWTETTRLNKVVANRAPHIVSTDYYDSLRSHSDAVEALAEYGIAVPALYAEGFLHNNCSGFCVKAGQKHFAHMLEVRPDLYQFAEQGEEAFRCRVKKDVSILKDRRGVKPGEKARPLTLRALRERLQGGEEADQYDLGKCGCFVG